MVSLQLLTHLDRHSNCHELLAKAWSPLSCCQKYCLGLSASGQSRNISCKYQRSKLRSPQASQGTSIRIEHGLIEIVISGGRELKDLNQIWKCAVSALLSGRWSDQRCSAPKGRGVNPSVPQTFWDQNCFPAPLRLEHCIDIVNVECFPAVSMTACVNLPISLFQSSLLW